MNADLVRLPDEPKWGTANPRRGAPHEDKAIAFIKDFPVGTVLSPETFDSWAQHHGWLNVPTGAPKQSDAWLAHLQRRHQLRYSINKAGAHPRMVENGASAFTIESEGLDVWVVRAPHEAIPRHRMVRAIETLVVTKRKKLTHLMQSADWPNLPPAHRLVAESLYNDVDGFERRVNLEGVLLNEKFTRLEAQLRRSVEAGEVTATNGAIKALTDGKDDPNDPNAA